MIIWSSKSAIRLAVAGLIICLSACMSAAPSPAPAPATEADPNRVSYWMEVAAENRVGWFERTPDTSRPDAVVALAMFEAANAIEQKYPSYLGFTGSADEASAQAAIDAAAMHALALLYDDQSGDALDLTNASVALGHAAAEAAWARGKAMTGRGPEPFRTNAPVGTYVPTETISAIAPFDLSLSPWALPDSEAARPVAPVSLDSETYLNDWTEVRDLGGKQSAARSAAQTETAWFWFFIDMNPVLREIAETPGRTPAQNARMYAMFCMATDDAWIASAEAKAHYQFWRPVTAIRQADRDTVSTTERDMNWAALIATPPHPEYPCAHCVQAAAQREILRRELDDETRVFSIVSSTVPDAPARAVTLDGYVRETSLSRIYAGAHYRFSNDAGEQAGAEVGRFVLEAWPSERADNPD